MGKKPDGYPRYYKSKVFAQMMWEIEKEGDHPMVIANSTIPHRDPPMLSSYGSEHDLVQQAVGVYRATKDGVPIRRG